jgi:RNA polymerase sigma-70 factor (ECF subfamily)
VPTKNQTYQGQHERVDALHEAYSASLLRFLRGFTRDRQSAEDLVQETFLRTWQSIDSVPSEQGGARRWLFTVARRVAIDAARMAQARPAEVALAELGPATAADGEVESALVIHDFRAALNKLSDNHRMVLSEMYWRGRPVQEIAGHLGIPAGTVRSRAHYAVRALRAALEPGT